MLAEYCKHLLVRTPLESAAHRFRRSLRWARVLRHPELAEILAEPRLIEEGYQRLLEADSCCIDVGAHLGSQLSAFVRLCPAGRHVAFEPIPYKAKWLRRKFPEVEVQQVALSDARGEATFFVNNARSGYSGLRPHGRRGDPVDVIRVERALLDEMIPPERRVSFLKIDVEGGELSVLEGAARVLSRWRPTLLLESTATGLSKFELTPERVFDYLDQRGYRLYLPGAVVGGGTHLDRRDFAEAHVYPFRAFNFFALPAGLP